MWKGSQKTQFPFFLIKDFMEIEIFIHFWCVKYSLGLIIYGACRINIDFVVECGFDLVSNWFWLLLRQILLWFNLGFRFSIKNNTTKDKKMSLVLIRNSYLTYYVELLAIWVPSNIKKPTKTIDFLISFNIQTTGTIHFK